MDFEQFDEGYLLRLRRGDPDAEQHFTNYFGQLILIKLRRRLASRAAIEDARQETFLRVFRILRSEEGVRHPERLGALVNSVCNHVVSESRRKDHRHEALPVSGGAQTDAGLLDSLITEEQAREVRWVLAELPERDRRLLSAAFMDEGGRDSLCADLDVNRDYLRVLLHRAKQSFRARLAQRRAAEGAGPRAGAGAGRH